MDLYFNTNNAMNCLGETLEGGDCILGRLLFLKRRHPVPNIHRMAQSSLRCLC